MKVGQTKQHVRDVATRPRRIEARLDRIESADGPVTALAGLYEDGHVLTTHSHGRAQLLSLRTGIVMVSTPAGRWLVPPEHAMWIPAGVEHSVEMLGPVEMRSVYLAASAGVGGPAHLAVLGTTELSRALIGVVLENVESDVRDERARLATALLVAEIPNLIERPLALPLPRDRRLARLCRDYIAQPTGVPTIEAWSSDLGMSRRAFTRLFRRELGLGLSTWRQQACLLAALPRLAEGETITSVALDLGYSSVPAFTAMFTRMLGTPPSHYLRKSGA